MITAAFEDILQLLEMPNDMAALCTTTSLGTHAWQLRIPSEASGPGEHSNVIVGAAAEASASTSGKLKSKRAPTRLADMPAFHNVTVAELVPHRQGLMYLLEFDQPRLPSHFRTGKASHAQVSPAQTLERAQQTSDCKGHRQVCLRLIYAST